MWRSVCGGVVMSLAALSAVAQVQGQSIDQLLDSVGAVAPQASFAADPTPRATHSGDALRDAVKSLLSRSIVDGKPTTDEALVRELSGAFRDLKQDDTLGASERAELQRSVSQRLQVIAGQLRRRLPQAGQHVLGQQGFFGGGAPNNQANPGQAVDPAQELIDVIQDTIAPTTWEIRGGQGVIRFWGPGNALIIRQTSDVHTALAQLIEDLHP